MGFHSQSEFRNWCKKELNNYSEIKASWISPSTYYNIFHRIFKYKYPDLNLPDVYKGGWKGIDEYIDKIWLNNLLLLTSSSYTPKGFTDKNPSSGYSKHSYYSSHTDSYKSSQNFNSQNDESVNFNNRGYNTSNRYDGSNDSIGNVVIHRHNFDRALKKIDDFANSVPELKNLDKFSTDGGLFGWGDHYINGYEMNRHVEALQDIFREHLEAVIETRKEFRDVYSTFDWLDKEYLQGIMGAVNEANKASRGAIEASNQAKTASVEAKEAIQRALNNEKDIKNDVENLKKVIEKIKSIKEQYSTKISEIEASLEIFQKDLNRLKGISSSQNEIENIKKNIEDIQNYVMEEKSQENNIPETSESSVNSKLIWSYVIGGLGLVCSIIALCV